MVGERLNKTQKWSRMVEDDTKIECPMADDEAYLPSYMGWVVCTRWFSLGSWKPQPSCRFGNVTPSLQQVLVHSDRPAD